MLQSSKANTVSCRQTIYLQNFLIFLPVVLDNFDALGSNDGNALCLNR
jgi:hypothetical protein